MRRYIDKRKDVEKPEDDQRPPSPAPGTSGAIQVIHVIVCGPTDGENSSTQRKSYDKAVNVVEGPRKKVDSKWESQSISEDEDIEGVQTPHDDVLIVLTNIGGMGVRRLLVDTGSSCDIL